MNSRAALKWLAKNPAWTWGALTIFIAVIAALIFHPHLLSETDAITYEKNARQFLEKGFFAEYWKPSLRAWRPHGYSLFIVGVYSVFGASLKALLLIQIVLLGGLVVFLSRTAQKILRSDIGGHLAGALAVIYVPFYYYAFTALPELLYLFLISLSFWLFSVVAEKWNGHSGALWAIGLGAALGIADLIKTNIFYFFGFALVPMLLLFWLYHQRELVKPTRLFFLGALAFACVTAPYLIRNYYVIGRYDRIASYSGYNLFLGNVSLSHGDWWHAASDLYYGEVDRAQAEAEASTRNEAEADDLLKARAMTIIRANRGRMVKKIAHVTVVMLNERSGSYFSGQTEHFLKLQYQWIVILAFTGALALLLLGDAPLFAWGSLLYIAYYLAIVSLTFPMPRFKEPLMVPFLILSAAGILLPIKKIQGSVGA